jgi:hypothetical protein
MLSTWLSAASFTTSMDREKARQTKSNKTTIRLLKGWRLKLLKPLFIERTDGLSSSITQSG